MNHSSANNPIPSNTVNDNDDRHISLEIKEKYWAWFSFGASHLVSDRDINY